MAHKDRSRSAPGNAATAARADIDRTPRAEPSVQNANEHPPTAHSLEEAANSDNSLEGYAAANSNEQQEIAKIAYRLYEERGGHHGMDQDDWYNAEREYRQRLSQQGPTKV